MSINRILGGSPNPILGMDSLVAAMAGDRSERTTTKRSTPTRPKTSRTPTEPSGRGGEPPRGLEKLAAISSGFSPSGAGSGLTRFDFTAGFRPTLGPLVMDRPIFSFFPQPKTTTELAQSSIQLLVGMTGAVVQEAVNAVNAVIKDRRLSRPSGLTDLLERRVRVGEVLRKRAAHWDDRDVNDFASEFRVDAKKTDVMDAIVAIAVLNDPDLDDDIRAENIDAVADDELLENRRIVWQHPAAGTPLEPPYMVMVAVEHLDLAAAEEAVDSILDQLVAYKNYRLPKIVTTRLK